MLLTTIDWAIIVGYFLVTLGIGAFFTRRAGKSLAEFFVSGRSLPWWIAGTSMVATTFAADTPLAITGLITKNGLAGNWIWWSLAIGGMLTVFVYARLWRRAEVMTDVELIRIRYGGPAANGLRYLRSFYVALIVNPIIIGWVIGAMIKVLKFTVFSDYPSADGGLEELPFWNQDTAAWAAVIGMMVVVGIYCTLSGMWGVVIADMMQFTIAMAGCIWLAIVAVNHVGGIEEMQSKVEASFGDRAVFDYLPSLGTGEKFDSDEYTGFVKSESGEAIKLGEKEIDFAQIDNVVAAARSSADRFLVDQEEKLAPVMTAAMNKAVENLEEAKSKLAKEDTQKNRDQFEHSVQQMGSSFARAMPGPWMLLHVFLFMLTMQWWATWYPGAEPGGGGYVVQRMASCKDEKHAILATLWYQIAHYCVRPWPWIIISFAALAIFPTLRSDYIADSSFDPGVGFPMVMKELCTPGLAGMMLVAFFAAFMSTMSTQMNWGASYLVRDFIQPLFMADADDTKLTFVSRVTSIGILCVGLVFGYVMNEAGVSVDDAWKILMALGAGTGLVFMLRWFWWRINAYSEIVGMVASLVYFLALNNSAIATAIFGKHKLLFEEQMAIVAVATIVTWLIATFLTPPESKETLRAFFRKVRPGGPGWKPIAAEEPDVEQDKDLGISIVGALFASGIVYLTLPAIGNLIFGHTTAAICCLAGAAFCAGVVGVVLKKLY
ncbi:MAG: sodium:solute symporter family protein [Mariniblastus sp.]